MRIFNKIDDLIGKTPLFEISNIENQIAAAQVEADDRFKRSPEEEALKNLTISKLMNQLQKAEVEVPKRLTIADIMNGSNFGERLGTLAQYAQQPEFQRNIGNLFGPIHRNPQTGEYTSYGEKIGREAEARLQADEQRALEEQKLQNGIASNIYNIMNGIDTEAMREDRFNRQMAMQNEQFYQSLGQRAAENMARLQADRDAVARQEAQQNFLNDLQTQKLQLEKDRLEWEKEKEGMKANGAGGMGNMTAADKKALTENKTTLSNIEAAMKALDENPNAYTWYKGKMGADIANRLYPKEVKTRTQIDNITAVYRKWLTGAQMSDKERLAYERFLPAPSDNYNIVKAKLQGMKESIERSNQALMENYGMTPQADENADPMGLGF